MSEISVIGSGRWGTFLAWYAANYCHMDRVKIYSKPDSPDFIESEDGVSMDEKTMDFDE